MFHIFFLITRPKAGTHQGHGDPVMSYGKGPATSNEILLKEIADNHSLGLTPTAGDYVLLLAPTKNALNPH